jgi:hypothetical protein
LFLLTTIVAVVCWAGPPIVRAAGAVMAADLTVRAVIGIAIAHSRTKNALGRATPPKN